MLKHNNNSRLIIYLFISKHKIFIYLFTSVNHLLILFFIILLSYIICSKNSIFLCMYLHFLVCSMYSAINNNIMLL
jgi:hypothetical protein